MSMTWAEVLDLYLQGTNHRGSATGEKFTHLTYGYQRVMNALGDAEVWVPEAAVSTVADQDWVEMDPDVHSIKWVQNKTGGHKVLKEPEGMRGRVRFFEAGESRPPTGPIEGVNFYVHEGNRIYLRDTPNEVGVLQIGFRMHAPKVDSSTDLTTHPITPQHYDMAIVKVAIGNYFTIHPNEAPLTADSIPTAGYGDSMIRQGMADIAGQKSPESEENLDHQKYTWQPGYEFTVGGR